MARPLVHGPDRREYSSLSAAPSRRGSRPGLPDDLQRMPGGSPGAVLYLLAAGNTGRRDDRVLGLRADGREQPELADAHGNLVVLRLEAEGAGHAAAPGVNLGDVGARDAAEQGRRGGRARERLLVAVTVEQHAVAADGSLLRADEPAVSDGLHEQFLGQSRGGRHGA